VSTPASSTALPVKAAKGRVWVTYWGSPADNKDIQAISSVFTEAPVELQNVSGDYTGTLTTLMAAGTPPDVSMFSSAGSFDLISQGAFTDIQPLIQRDKLDMTDFVPAALDAYRYHGGLYGLPKNFHTESIWYNIELFHEAGVQPPGNSWTTDDYLQAAQKLTDRGKGLFGTTLPIGAEFTLAWIWLFGGDVVDNPDNVTKVTYSNPKTIEAIQWLADLRARYHVAPTTEESAAAKGDVNMFYGGFIGTYPYLYVEGRMATLAKGFTWDVAPLPSGPGGTRGNYVNTGGWFMPKGSTNPDLGWRWMQAATSPAGMKMDATTGVGIPARLSVTTWPEWTAGPPSHKDVFIEQAKYSHPYPHFPGVGTVLDAAWKELTSVFVGTTTAAAAAVKADAAANAALQKYLSH